jgi:hypothetical protein
MRFLILSGLLFWSTVGASARDEPSYFIFDNNPVAAKYVAGRLVHLPYQDADDAAGLQALESVSALQRAPRLQALSAGAQPVLAHISPARMTEYGVPMFEIAMENGAEKPARPRPLVWSGPAAFEALQFSRPRTDPQLRRRLVADSRRVLAPRLDFRDFEPVHRRLDIVGPAKVRDYGRLASAPHLAFVDVTWRIKALPDALANRGIDSMSPFLRVEYVVDTRTGRTIYLNTSNDGAIVDRDMLLFKEPGGPLLMAVTIGCTDGSEPLILDLEHESYGTGQPSDIPDLPHCFPAQ